MYHLHWMPNPDVSRDEFDIIERFEYVEYAFRYEGMRSLTWTCDGDGWSSETTFREVKGKWEVGVYYISRW